jgi:hypothetical protein
VERKQRTMAFIGRASRWSAVLAVALAVLSAQQSWGAPACHCESHSKLTGNVSYCAHDGEEPTTANRHSTCDDGTTLDPEEATETHHRVEGHKGHDREGPWNNHPASERESLGTSSTVPPAAVVNGLATRTGRSGLAGISCCFLAQTTAPEVLIAPFSNQQPIPIDGTPAFVVTGTLVTAASGNIHGPPGFTCSRPLYIVQSSLLI